MKIYEQFDEEESWWENESPFDKIEKPIIGTEEFTRFLIDNNVYDKFIDNVKMGRGKMSMSENFKCNPNFSSAFRWADSNEGELFWRKISDKWNRWQRAIID